MNGIMISEMVLFILSDITKTLLNLSLGFLFWMGVALGYFYITAAAITVIINTNNILFHPSL